MNNLRGILLMVAAMAAFAVEDAFIKHVSQTLPTGEILVILGAGGTTVFAVLTRRRGERLLTRAMIARPVLLRNLGELIGTLGFVTALALTPLATASAILQTVPLAVTFGAAMFLGAPVGWRRWSAIGVGFAGVLMIIRPGAAGFELASLFAVQAVVGLALRDLATRAVPDSISTMQISTYAFVLVTLAGALLLALVEGPRTPTPFALAELATAIAFSVTGYYSITAAMRVGDVAVIPAFRYVRLIFALAIGASVFGERPDTWTLAGAALIIASGLYTLAREGRSRAPPVSSPTPGR